MRQDNPVRQAGDSASHAARGVSSQVEEFLRQRVLRGEWPAGHKLPSEAELGKQFNASRTVIREAIGRMQGRGLLQTVNGSGTYVSSGRLEDVSLALNAYSVLSSDQQTFIDLLELRMAIEGDAAAKVAARRDADDWQRLEARLEVMSGTRILEEFAILDIDFHMDVLRLSGNELFASLGSALRDRYVRFAIDSYRGADHLRADTLAEHRLIVDAIASGDPERARQAARRHVSQSRGRWENEHRTDAGHTPAVQPARRAPKSPRPTEAATLRGSRRAESES